MTTKYRCRTNSDHKNFLATAKVSQEWLCNEDGEYVKTVTERIDVLHDPKELEFACRECGRIAEEYEYMPDVADTLREHDWSGWSIGEQETLFLYGKDGECIAKIDQTNDSGNRIFKSRILTGTPMVKSTHDKSLADAIAWCEDNCKV